MPYRPLSELRQNQKVIHTLTEAIRRTFGKRDSDGAYPLGPFYSKTLNPDLWIQVDNTWYIPAPSLELDERWINDEDVERFRQSIVSGDSVMMSDSSVNTCIEWEEIPEEECEALPPLNA